MGRLDASQDSPLHHSSFYHSHVQPENAGLVIGQLCRNEFRDPPNPTRVTDAPYNRMNVYDARPKQTEREPHLADFNGKVPWRAYETQLTHISRKWNWDGEQILDWLIRALKGDALMFFSSLNF